MQKLSTNSSFWEYLNNKYSGKYYIALNNMTTYENSIVLLNNIEMEYGEHFIDISFHMSGERVLNYDGERDFIIAFKIRSDTYATELEFENILIDHFHERFRPSRKHKILKYLENE